MTDKCIIINRVSSVEQTDGYSLEAQSRKGLEYATNRDYEIVEQFTFQESASKALENKKFNEIVQFIRNISDKSTNPLHVIVEKRDRLGRLHSRKEIFQNLIWQEQIVLHFYREGQILDVNSSPELFLVDDLMTAVNVYVAKNIGKEAKKGMLEKARQGWLPHKPPPGYMNNPDKKADVAILINPAERKWVERIFELRAVERLSYDHISQKVIDEKLVPTHRARTFRRSYVEKILHNPFYGGRFVFSGVEYQGKHELIIPRHIFRQVQALFRQSGIPKSRKEEAVFTGFLKCGHPDCGCNICFERHTKKSGKVYHRYACTNGRKVHPSKKGLYVNEGDLMRGFESAVNNIDIPEEFAKKVADALNKTHHDLQRKLKQEEETYRRGIKNYEAEEDVLYADHKKGILDEAAYRRQIDNIRKEKERLTNLIFEIQHGVSTAYLNTALDILELAKNAKTLWLSRNSQERVEFLKKILSNAHLSGRRVEYHLKKPFLALSTMVAAEDWGE